MRPTNLMGMLAVLLAILPACPATTRAVESVADVRSYGAKMDGTDDSSALIRAIAAVPASGGTVLISGTIGLGSKGWNGILMQGKSGISIVGSGAGSGIRVLYRPSQTIQSGGGTSNCLIRISNSTRVTIRDLDFHGNGIQTTFIAFDNVTDSSIRNNRFHDTPEDETTPRIAPAVQSNSGVRNMVRNNHFRNVDYGVGLGGWGKGKEDRLSVITENVFEHILNDSVLIGGSDIAVAWNIFNGAGRAAIIIGEIYGGIGSSRIIITGNTIRDSLWTGVQADLTPPKRLDRITIAGNTFDNNLQSGAVLHHTNHSVFRGNTVRGGQWGVVGSAVDNLVIEENVFSGQSKAGIQFTQDNIHFVANLTVSNNNIESRSHNTFGIFVPSHSAGTGNRNLVINGNIIRTSGYAIWIWNGFRDVLITNNILKGGTADIRSDDESYSTIGANNLLTTRAGRRIGSMIDGKRIHYGTNPPTAGTWQAGDRVLRDPPASGQPRGWVCITPGTPGRWVPEKDP